MLAKWLIAKELNNVTSAQHELSLQQQQVATQRWLLKQQADDFFRRKDALFCAFIAGCVKGLSSDSKSHSRSSLISLVATAFKLHAAQTPEN